MISWKRKSPPYDKLSSVLSHTHISSKSHPHAICPCSLLKYGTSVLQSEIQQSLDMAGLPIRFPFQRFFLFCVFMINLLKKTISIAFCFSFNTYLKLITLFTVHLFCKLRWPCIKSKLTGFYYCIEGKIRDHSWYPIPFWWYDFLWFSVILKS